MKNSGANVGLDLDRGNRMSIQILADEYECFNVEDNEYSLNLNMAVSMNSNFYSLHSLAGYTPSPTPKRTRTGTFIGCVA